MELIETKTRKYTSEQKTFIEADINQSIILGATAGSGKSQCTMERIRFLLSKGVPANKIIFFSYTTAAVEEFRSRLKNDDVKITTIHAFCLSMLAKMQKFKKIIDIYDFINWFKVKYKPGDSARKQDKDEFYRVVTNMYDDAQYIASEIAAFKLQSAEGTKCRIPKYLTEYRLFAKETKARDFSDMLIETNNLLKENKWLKMFKNKYDYIIVDEAQDTSVIQLQILLALNAKYYTIIGDEFQSIYGYSGANYKKILSMVKKRRDCKEMSLSTNFRSDKLIVEHANQYSNLKAISNSNEDGTVHKKIILFEDLLKLLDKHEEVAILVRTNAVIKEMEKNMLKRKQLIQYTNYITPNEIEDIKNAKEKQATMNKLKPLIPVYKSVEGVIEFIENCNRTCKSFLRTVHRSKGLEWDICVIVNCVSPEILTYNNIKNLDEKTFKAISFNPGDEDDFEAQAVFYVAVTRARKENYFLIYGY